MAAAGPVLSGARRISYLDVAPVAGAMSRISASPEKSMYPATRITATSVATAETTHRTTPIRRPFRDSCGEPSAEGSLELGADAPVRYFISYALSFWPSSYFFARPGYPAPLGVGESYSFGVGWKGPFMVSRAWWPVPHPFDRAYSAALSADRRPNIADGRAPTG